MKNNLCIAALLFVLFSPIALLPPRVYNVQASSVPAPVVHTQLIQATQDAPNDQTLQVLMEAHKLVSQFGTRPYWKKASFSKLEIPPADEISDIIAHLIPCENEGRLLHPGTVAKIVDSNGFYSYGLLMIQQATWDGWSKTSGIFGDPDDANDAVLMATWAIGHGQLYQWSCARTLGILKKS